MKKRFVILGHSGFWLIFLLFATGAQWSKQWDTGWVFSWDEKPQIKSFIDVGIDLVRDIEWPYLLFIFIIPPLFFYAFYSYFIPRLLCKKTWQRVSIPVLFFIFVSYFIVALYNNFTFAGLAQGTTTYLIYTIALGFSVLGSIYRLLENWMDNRILTQKLIRQNLQSELALLKSQINPHFLFNTLHSIDSLIKREPDKASATLIQLSDLLRYMIYESNTEKVLLSDEIKYLEEYIELQKIQYANSAMASFSVSGSTEAIQVAPMLFIPFVENAFKHCTNKEAKEAIRISFEINEGVACFEAVNLFDKEHPIEKDKTGGIGLNTVKRWLELLYPNKSSLFIEEKEGVFKVKLTIDTNED